MKVQDLVPGDRVEGLLASGTFVSASPHPLYPGDALVVWVMDGDVPLLEDGDGAPFPEEVQEAYRAQMASRSIRLDALSWNTDVGKVDRVNGPAREERLLQALLGGQS